jgi:hypothetical protein
MVLLDNVVFPTFNFPETKDQKCVSHKREGPKKICVLAFNYSRNDFSL